MMRDLIGIAQTGTGKTASFVLPMIDILAHGRRRAMMPRSLILEPTRELAAQVAENFEKYGKNHDLKMALLIGGVQMGDQVKALNEGVDVLIATPGPADGPVRTRQDPAHRLRPARDRRGGPHARHGLHPRYRDICSKLPATRQTLLFSATMPPPIKKLADKFLSNPKYIEVSRPAIVQPQHRPAQGAGGRARSARRCGICCEYDNVSTAIVFCNRKTTVRELATRA
jgi:superfamily II DNA/RNA helicase